MAAQTDIIIGLNALPYYLKRIHAFLDNDKKSLSFPGISQQLQAILVRLTTEVPEFLNSDDYSNAVKLEAAHLATAMKTHPNVKLAYEISDGKLGSDVLTYKKIQINPHKPIAIEPLRKPSTVVASSPAELPLGGGLTLFFKTHALNMATKFVKDDSQVTLRFPQMDAREAAFIMDMILPGIEGKTEKSDVGFGYRSMYAPLWESMRVFSLKYSFRIEYDNSTPVDKEGAKWVVFKKIPKSKIKQVASLDSTPVIVIDSDDEDDVDANSTSSSLVSLNNNLVFKNTKMNKQLPIQTKVSKKIEKLIRKIGIRMQRGDLVELFIMDALKRMAGFLLDDRQKKIEFLGILTPQHYFLSNIKNFSSDSATHMLFSSDCQKLLNDIRYCISKKKVQFEMKNMKRPTELGLTHLNNTKFEKVYIPELDPEASEVLNSSISSKSVASTASNTSLQTKKQETIAKARKKKLNKVTTEYRLKLQRGLLTNQFIVATLQRLCDFLNDEKQACVDLLPENQIQLQFFQQVAFIAREPVTYEVFSSEAGRLLAQINRHFTSNRQYQLNQIRGQKNVIVVKTPNFHAKESTKERETNEKSIFKQPAAVSEVIDVEMYELNRDSKQRKPSEINPKESPKPTNLSQKHFIKVQNNIANVYVKMRRDNITSEFIQTTLQRIKDYLRNDHENSIVFQNLNPDQLRFVKMAAAIAGDPSWHTVFTAPSQRLLTDIQTCFNNNRTYSFKSSGGTTAILEKTSTKTKETNNVKENNENVNGTNILAAPCVGAPLTQLEQEKLLEYKQLKEKIVGKFGEQYIEHYLNDISRFLTQSNADNVLIFEDITLAEVQFLKRVHALSKFEASYALFSRECQKLLRNIQFNAQSYDLNFQVQLEGNVWTVFIKKQPIGAKEKNEVKQRARSMSAQRRKQAVASERRGPAAARADSSQRLSVKDKLKAALAQPVRSEIALRMMESMGWTGGALGLRGDGITEPIALPLDLAKRAGLGHVPKSKPPKPEPKPIEAKKTKSKEPPSSSPATTPRLPEGCNPVGSLPGKLIPPGILPSGGPSKINSVVLNKDYHEAILRSILELVSTDNTETHFFCTTTPPKRIFGFLKHAVTCFNGRHRLELNDDVLISLVGQISHTMDISRNVYLDIGQQDKFAMFLHTLVIRKKKVIPSPSTKDVNDIMLIYGNQDTTNEYAPETTNEQTTTATTNETITDLTSEDNEITLAWYQERSKTIEERTKTNKQQSETTHNKEPKSATTDAITANIQKTTLYTTQNTTGRPWYFPVTSKLQELKLSQNQIPELKALALVATCRAQNIEADINVQNPDKTKDTKNTVNQRETIHSPKQPQTTNPQKQSETINQLKQPETTHSQKQPETTDSPKQAETTEFKKPSGVLLLQKLVINNINNNYSTKNKNVGIVKDTTKPVKVSERLQNTIANCKKEIKSINVAPTDNNVASTTKNIATPPNTAPTANSIVAMPNNMVTSSNHIATTPKNIATISNHMATTPNNEATNIVDNSKNVVEIENLSPPINCSTPKSDVSETDVICNKANKMSIGENANISPISNRVIEIDDTETVAYIIPVETIETDLHASGHEITDIVNDKNEGLTENGVDEHANSNIDKCQNNISENVDDDDVDCEIVFDESVSTIIIDSDDEEFLLASDNGVSEHTNNVVEQIEKVTIEKDVIDSKKGFLHEAVTIIDEETSEDYNTLTVFNNEQHPIQARKRPSLDYPNTLPKKCKLTYKKLYIIPKNYPQTEIGIERASKIQSAILKSIDYTQETLPCLKCQGIQKGGLIYCCQDEKSMLFLENVVQNMADLKIVYEFDVKEKVTHKMKFRINTYLNEPVCHILNRLEVYNTGLFSTKWSVNKKEKNIDFAVIHVEVDEASFNYICDANFVLFAGNDCARFTIIWD